MRAEASNGYPVAPDFILTDIDGNSFSLSGYRGRVVLLGFFHTNCTPSVDQFSELVIISISTEIENETILRDFREACSIKKLPLESNIDLIISYTRIRNRVAFNLIKKCGLRSIEVSRLTLKSIACVSFYCCSLRYTISPSLVTDPCFINPLLSNFGINSLLYLIS
jgi:hypothetical protein